MKIKLSELRALIVEAMDPMRLIVVPDQINDACALITDDNDQERMRGGMMFRYLKSVKAYEVTAAWATDPRAAIALFSACLVAKGRLVPDADLTPAAKVIIKRWYERHKNDGSILLGLSSSDDRESPETDPAFNSIYTVPAGFSSPVPIEQVRDRADIKQYLLKGILDGFGAAYQNLEKTGQLNFKKFLSNRDWPALQKTLAKALSGNDIDVRNRTIAWFRENANEIKRAHVPWERASNWTYLADEYNLPIDLWSES